jgi:hypothetical protein
LDLSKQVAALPGIEIYYPEVLAEIIAEQRDNLPAASPRYFTFPNEKEENRCADNELTACSRRCS